MAITRGRRINSSGNTYPGIWGVTVRLHRCYQFDAQEDIDPSGPIFSDQLFTYAVHK